MAKSKQEVLELVLNAQYDEQNWNEFENYLNQGEYTPADLNQIGNNSFTLLHHAVFHRSKESIMLLIAKGANIEAPDNNGVTPLGYAAIRGKKEVVELLLSTGAKIEAQDNKGGTPLLYALLSDRSNDETIKTLIKAGAKLIASTSTKARLDKLVEEVNQEQNPAPQPIIPPAKSDNKALEDLKSILEGTDLTREVFDRVHENILKHMYSIDDLNKKHNNTHFLLKAASQHRWDIVETLIDTQGIDLNAQDVANNQYDKSFIHYLVENYQYDLITKLKDKNINLNAINKDNKTPLYIAVEKNDLEMVKRLLDHGDKIDVNAQNGTHGSALHFAVKEKRVEIAKALLSHKNINKGGTLSDLAKYSGNEELRKLFGLSTTPLHDAIANGDNNELDKLIESKNEYYEYLSDFKLPVELAIDKGNLYAYTKLVEVICINSEKLKKHYNLAAEAGHVNIMQAIPSEHIDQNTKDDAIRKAAAAGHENVVEYLMDNLASITAGGVNENNALHIAVGHGHSKVIKVLLSRKEDDDIYKRGTLPNANKANRLDQVVRYAHQTSNSKTEYLKLMNVGNKSCIEIALESPNSNDETIKLLLKAGATKPIFSESQKDKQERLDKLEEEIMKEKEAAANAAVGQPNGTGSAPTGVAPSGNPAGTTPPAPQVPNPPAPTQLSKEVVVKHMDSKFKISFSFASIVKVGLTLARRVGIGALLFKGINNIMPRQLAIGISAAASIAFNYYALEKRNYSPTSKLGKFICEYLLGGRNSLEDQKVVEPYVATIPLDVKSEARTHIDQTSLLDMAVGTRNTRQYKGL
ncbi:MAG: ankyrin repeat domain-containing protein [Alphaproteobacteria bacterium]|nr:ankyrin repeat domain-containing protein [Alphaproteobacteria bacterium]OJV13474.1 MAG: hypothetical protein BGO27_04610 [Alphaproteobacteria bacterium 33-17]